jgi:hypothetical protein
MKKREQSGVAFAVSIALHVVLLSGLFWVLSLPMPLRQWLTEHRPVVLTQESVRYSQLGGGAVKVHAGGNGKPQRGAPMAARELAAPLSVPNGVPVTKPGAKAVAEEGTGPVVSAGGAGPGIMPVMHDPRVWLPPGAVIVAPLSDSQRFDSAFHETLAHMKDTLQKGSAAKALAGVFTAGGKKYGVDSANIYIADYKIPAALLAVLPIHGTGWSTPEQAQLNRQTREINYQAGRALDAEDFRTAVRRIRQRKERERRAKEVAAGKVPSGQAPLEAPEPVRKPVQPDPIALQSP